MNHSVPKIHSDLVIHNVGKNYYFKLQRIYLHCFCEYQVNAYFALPMFCIVMFSLQLDYMFLKNLRMALLHSVHIS